MKRIHSAVALAAAAALALTACTADESGNEAGAPGVPQSEEEVTKLTVLVTDSPSATFLKEAGAEYTASTGIDVEFVSVPNAQLPTKMILAGQANQATFDIAQFDALTMPTIVPSGALQPLDTFIDADEAYDIDDFPDALQEYSKYEDVTYGVPLSTEPFVNFYRTDLFEELGLELPTTWEEVNEQAAEFSDAGYYGYCGYWGPALSARAYTERLYSSGGRLLDPETNEPLLSTDFAKQVMEDYVALAPFSPESTYSSGQTGATTAFTQLDCAQMVAPSGWYGVLADPTSSNVADTFSAGLPPMSDGGDFEPKHILYGWLAGVSAQSPHQQGAWDFLSFALGK
ncbi:ABC transporter substrate-binding protein, partial [Microbacterium lacus]|uniref:ABC transporter substrate-binding protein n=1 Tax=Microbacterium lacus TaxID=415217 RepID=UPI0031D4F0BE